MMKLISAIVVTSLAIGLQLNAAPSCTISEPNRNVLLHHLAWSDYWWGTNYLERPEIHFYFAETETRAAWYLPRAVDSDPPALSMVFSRHKVQPEALGGSSCALTPKSVTECLESQLGKAVGPGPTRAEMMQGIGPRVEYPKLRPEEIQECSIPSEQVTRWKPSPESAAKRQLYAKITEEVFRQAGRAGLRRVYINDFHLGDPRVFAVVDYAPSPDGVTPQPSLISMEISGSGDGSAHTVRIDEGDSIPSNTVIKIDASAPLQIYP
jgi:hypothetical protein